MAAPGGKGRRKRSSGHPVPRPFLKWAGGKGESLPHLLPLVAKARPFARYHEPFLGGGALFFALHREGLRPGEVFLSDSNERLIETFVAVRDEVEALIERLVDHKARHDKEHYYAVRAEVPADRLGRAARIIYLNKTCFNGLYRENSKGEFNVPIGRYRDPPICDAENLRAVSLALEGCDLQARSFEAVRDHASPGDLVYFDPPYVPVSDTSYFTAYHKGGFGPDDQARLGRVARDLWRDGVRVILSNSWTPTTRDLYRGFDCRSVQIRRRVNANSEARAPVGEILAHNIGRNLPRDLGNPELPLDG